MVFSEFTVRVVDNGFVVVFVHDDLEKVFCALDIKDVFELVNEQQNLKEGSL